MSYKRERGRYATRLTPSSTYRVVAPTWTTSSTVPVNPANNSAGTTASPSVQRRPCGLERMEPLGQHRVAARATRNRVPWRTATAAPPPRGSADRVQCPVPAAPPTATPDARVRPPPARRTHARHRRSVRMHRPAPHRP